MKTTHSIDSKNKSAFWLFALDLYDNPAIDEACSILQTRYQLNMNLIFFCCFLAKENYRPMTQDEIELLISRTTPWNRRIVSGLTYLHGLVKRLRNQKSYLQLKTFYALEKEILDNRRFANQAEQSLMLPLISHLEKQKEQLNPESIALTNIFTYINHQRISIHQNDLEKIYRIVKQCFLS